jgi:hypothetical protein
VVQTFKRIDENSARNAAKHMGEIEPAVQFDPEDAALWMIVRACDNLERLGLTRSARISEFESWFYEQIVGL